MINERIYNNVLKKLISKKDELDGVLYQMELFFQPYFKDEIYITHQPSDGFVIVVVFEGNEPSNINLCEAKRIIELDPYHYLDCDFK
jgi:hypothetical protein